MDSEVTFTKMKERVREFSEERDWGQYHEAKDLSIGLITEASELLEHFRFKSPEECRQIMKDPAERKEIGYELADVSYFVFRFCQVYDIDLSEACKEKLAINELHYPVSKSKGKNIKYDKL